MRLHLEGMGVMGCLVACVAEQRGYQVSWEDNRSVRNAWQASTGAILPFGDDKSQQDLESWKRELFLLETIQPYLAEARYCYVAEQPPHKGRAAGVLEEQRVGSVKISNVTSLHMDVQSFVSKTRRRLAHQERKQPRGSMLVVTHGFGDNIHKWSWGWSAQVRVSFAARWSALCLPHVPMLYGRRGYQLPYLYPVGSTGYHYAGTTLITQSTPKSLPIKPKLDMWRSHIKDYTGGAARITALRAGSLREGWRPMAHPEAELVERSPFGGNEVRIAPQYGNGIRWFPSTWKALEEAING